MTSKAASIWYVTFLVIPIYEIHHHGNTIVFLTVVWLTLLISVPLLRRWTRHIAGGFSWWGQPMLVFGGGVQGAAVFEAFSRRPHLGLRPVGIVDDLHRQWDDSGAYAGSLGELPYLGPFSDTQEIARRYRSFWGAIAMAERSPSEIAALIDGHACSLPHLLMMPDADRMARGCDALHDCVGLEQMRLDERLLLPSARMLKRGIDLSVVGIVVLLAFPILFTLAMLVMLTSPGPIFFGHERIGRNGRRFRAWKFRSMVPNGGKVLEQYLKDNPEALAEWERDHKLKNDPRITRVGRFLRCTSLDELPQLWNVLCGDMSLVGPRPIVSAEVSKYSEVYPIYLRVRPGITGLWQVSGRNNTTYDERVALDNCYVRNWSPWLDLCILTRTVKTVLLGEGAY